MKDKNKKFLRLSGTNTVVVYRLVEGRFLSLRFLRKKQEVSAIDAGALPVEPVDNNCPSIISLARNKLTMRYLKNIPAQRTKEIEGIVALQAPQFLPYPAQELVTGYQVLSTDKNGYSDLNLVVAHKNTIERCLAQLPQADRRSIAIYASSWGLLNYYNFLRPQDNETTVIIDADRYQPELIVVCGSKLLFSRPLRVLAAGTSWQDEFCAEVDKSCAAYLKETGLNPPLKIVVVGLPGAADEITAALKAKLEIPVSAIAYDKIRFAAGLADKACNIEASLASLIGLAIKEVPVSLDLLPAQLKTKKSQAARKKELLRLALSVCGIMLIVSFGMARNLENKTRYLSLLRSQLDQAAQEAKPLEEIEKKLKAVEGQRQNGPGCLEALHELYRIIPQQLSLTMFGYDQGGSVTIRGASPELNLVFDLVTRLEKSSVFSGSAVKVQYATNRATTDGLTIDFEIICRREK